MAFVRFAALAVAVFLAVSTTGAAMVRLPTSSRQIGVSVARGWTSQKADSRHAWLYVGSDVDNVVTAYDLESAGNPLVRTITRGINFPGGLAIDGRGTLYVPNQHMATVTEYVPGSNEPSLTLTGTGSPQSVAVDAAGNVYVASRAATPGIAVYPPGATTPARYITSSLIHQLAQLAFDKTGTLYIVDTVTGVLVLTPGPSQVVASLNLQGLHNHPNGIVVGLLHGRLFVSNSTPAPDYLSVYGPGQQSAFRTKRLNYGGLDFIAAGIVQNREKIFVPDSLGNFIDVFDGTLRDTPKVISTVLGYVAVGVAFKPAGVL